MSRPDLDRYDLDRDDIDPLDTELIPPRVTQFFESRVLWIVLAFGAGVLVHDIADEHRYGKALVAAERAIAIAQTYADACGPAAMVVDIPAERAHWEGRP